MRTEVEFRRLCEEASAVASDTLQIQVTARFGLEEGYDLRIWRILPNLVLEKMDLTYQEARRLIKRESKLCSR